MDTDPPTTHHKARQINLDPTKYGTFAEIGAGQEVARWFFRVGDAAATIAKTISAYDMTVSDAIYGPTPRYVSRERLYHMLDHEYSLLEERLKAKCGASTRFFVFADTVAARSYKRKGVDSHGWMAVRFQARPLAEPSQIVIHVRMLDPENLLQQETLGIIGVNLIHGALYLHDDPKKFIQSLMDNLSRQRVEVDMLKFSGPDFRGVDNRLMSLELVESGLTDAAMFRADGEVVQAAEVLYEKPILVERGSFRPVTKVTLDMLEGAEWQFTHEAEVQNEEPVVLMEMTLKNLLEGGVIDHKDFLDRVDLLGSLGKTVLISNYGEFYPLAAYLFRYSKKRIGIAMGIPTLQDIFSERWYANLDGGILEAFGRLFKNGLKFYVYPLLDSKTGAITTVENFKVAPNLHHLYMHLCQNSYIESLKRWNATYLSIFSRDVLAKIRAHDPSWQDMVPAQVATLIEERRLFGC